MKFNKWTLGLAAVGIVSLGSAARADMMESTTISGYVDTSAQWNFGTGNGNPPPVKFNQGKQDGFNLDVVQLTIAKPLDEGQWAAGYHVDLWFGPDANTLGTGFGAYSADTTSSSDFAVRQAYVNLRTPVGNGIEWKIGVFDSIIGYESVAGPNNPNYTRSYGHSIEPQTHTGLLGSYRINDHVSVAAGVANTIGPTINARAFGEDGKAESFKTYMASVALTAPDSWGFLSGSTLYGGIVSGLNDNEAGADYDDNSTSYYAGFTMPTPVTGLRVGASWDYLDVHNINFGHQDGVAWAAALYTSYQATEKLSLHLRGEYVDDQAFFFPNGDSNSGFRAWEATATAQYDLWKNVLSRIEFRWDHSDTGQPFGGNFEGNPGLKNQYMLAANVIYKF